MELRVAVNIKVQVIYAFLFNFTMLHWLNIFTLLHKQEKEWYNWILYFPYLILDPLPWRYLQKDNAIICTRLIWTVTMTLTETAL